MKMTKEQVQDFINENGFIQDIGQIDKETRKALDKAVRFGLLVKSREPWCGISNPKTTWRLPCCANQ
jgi:hypothetical protein